MSAKLPSVLSKMQCRMARAALGWGVREVAKKANVGASTVHNFESGKRKPIRETIAAIRCAFEEAGVEFINLNGVIGPEEIAEE